LRRFGSKRFAATLLAIGVGVSVAGSVQAEAASIRASVTVLAIELRVDLSAAQARVGDKVKAQATVANVGPLRVSGVVVELRVSPGLGVKGPGTVTIARIQPDRTAIAPWTVCALDPGNYVVLARATLAGVALDSEARVLTVTPERRKGCA
jgi:hypothetical protein